MQEIALEQTAHYVMQHLDKVKAFISAEDLLRYAFDQVPASVKGIRAEFGVWRGRSLQMLANWTLQVLHGFDSFAGLPETWRTGFEEGHFRLHQSEFPDFPAHIQLVVGWFEESLPKFLASHPESFLFIHVDCDLYSSTKTILDLCGERVVPGTILVFDEFFNYPNWQQGEFQAFQEFIAEGGRSYRWLGYCSHGQQVAVQIV